MNDKYKTKKQLMNKLIESRQRIAELEKSEADCKQAKEALRENEEKYRTLVENINIGIYRNTGGPHGKFLQANPAIVKMFGYDSVEEFMKVRVSDLYQYPETRKHFVDEIVLKGFSKNKELRLRRKDGTPIIASCTAKVCYDEKGDIKWIDGVIEDITERKRIEEKLYALSIRDELTGLYNRRGFFTLVEQQLKLADRLKREIFILYADLDNLKWINDTLGHKEGDLVLIEAANILKESFRESDIIARIGGDEFVAVASPVGTNGDTTAVITARLQENFEIHAKRNKKYKLSISFGIAYYNPEYPCSIDELLVQADKLMYEQKMHKKKS